MVERKPTGRGLMATIVAALLGVMAALDLASLLFLNGEALGTRVLYALSSGIMLLGAVLFFLPRVSRGITSGVLLLGLAAWWARLAMGLVGGTADGEDIGAVLILGGVMAGAVALLIVDVRSRVWD
ncbi:MULTISPECIES: hypothetical protein [unclassified Corynebacterium]|uniref:hypothetical protein n=1 Tax=unclassified Corynebacterium TaxID=2624378 RepID=UPI0029CA2296|nr:MULTISPECIES: hypothetical protein [unclassified Corynebacterium]WPF66504.1 hypothetical protein OLX12_01895 [Corynebacterium sp. 22KM0430]WPF68993.1 hypothetical protein OLW90_01890 [Corynebacterium sp. 21KM1197]